MKQIISKDDKTKSIIIASSQEDADCLQFLYDNHICFGFYRLDHYMPEYSDDEQPSEYIRALRKSNKDIISVAHFSEVEGFVPPYAKKEIPPKKERLDINPELFNFLTAD